MSLPAADLDLLRRLVESTAGVALPRDGSAIAELRLDGVARREGFAGPADVLARLRAGGANGLERRVVEALLNNETSFFRDVTPFEALATAILPRALRRSAPGEPIQVWSAACSTGQEPYSVALLARERVPELAPRLRVLASDFSREALARARAGRYTQLEVNRGLPAAYLVRHFDKVGPEWRLRDELRASVEFREINLVEAFDVPLCDVVLLRNVLIYLPLEKRRALLERVRARLKPEGVVLLGASETTLGVDDGFDVTSYGGVACYRSRRPGGRSGLNDAAVEEVVRAVWSITLGWMPRTRDDGARPGPDAAVSSVKVNGGWRGHVVLRCAAGLARRAAAAMFKKPAERVSEADLRDALGELANMTAGNLRCELPGASSLGLPTSEEAGGAERLRMSFDCEGELLEVRVMEDVAT